MSENWKTYKIEDIASKISIGPFGSRMKSDCYVDEGIPVIRGKNLGERPDFISDFVYITEKKADELLGCNVFKGDLVFPHRGAIGEVGLVTKDERFVLSSSLMKLTCDNAKADSRFVYYFFKSDLGKRRLLLNESQVGTPGIGQPLSSLRDIYISLPELPEQGSIASILSAIDDKIELNLQMNKTLEEMAMTLYKHWFVDFGPFQDGEFVDSELGMIPKGWEVKRLDEILKIKHGYAFKGESFTTDENQNLLLTPGNFEIQGGIKFNWGKQKFYTGEYPSDYILKKGDLIIALTDLTQSCDILGAPALIPDEDYLYLHNQRLGLVTDLSPKLSKELVYCLANTVAFRSHIKNGKTGSTVSHTSPSRIYDYQIALPTDGISAILKEQLSELSELKFSNLSENKILTQTRDNLLPKLISGEVRVKEAETALAEVL